MFTVLAASASQKCCYLQHLHRNAAIYSTCSLFYAVQACLNHRMNHLQTHHASILFANGCDPLKPLAVVSRAPSESFPNPSLEHCLCKWRGGLPCPPPPPPKPTRCFRPCKLASKHMLPFRLFCLKLAFIAFAAPENSEMPLFTVFAASENSEMRLCTICSEYLQPLQTQKC